MANLKQVLSEKILAMPGETEQYWPTENGGLTSFMNKQKDFAHFIQFNEVLMAK